MSNKDGLKEQIRRAKQAIVDHERQQKQLAKLRRRGSAAIARAAARK